MAERSRLLPALPRGHDRHPVAQHDGRAHHGNQARARRVGVEAVRIEIVFTQHIIEDHARIADQVAGGLAG